jgi:hypothetical protein
MSLGFTLGPFPFFEFDSDVLLFIFSTESRGAPGNGRLWPACGSLVARRRGGGVLGPARALARPFGLAHDWPRRPGQAASAAAAMELKLGHGEHALQRARLGKGKGEWGSWELRRGSEEGKVVLVAAWTWPTLGGANSSDALLGCSVGRAKRQHERDRERGRTGWRGERSGFPFTRARDKVVHMRRHEGTTRCTAVEAGQPWPVPWIQKSNSTSNMTECVIFPLCISQRGGCLQKLH